MKLLLFGALSLTCLLSLSAQEKAPEDKKLTLARKVIELSHVDKSMEAMAEPIRKMMEQSMAAQKIPDDQKSQIEALQKKIVKITMEETLNLLPQLDKIYAEVYSEAELQAMADFFASPEGQSMIEKQPKIMEAMMPLLQGMQGRIAQKVQEAVQSIKAPKKP